jgi:hypothetical protein
LAAAGCLVGAILAAPLPGLAQTSGPLARAGISANWAGYVVTGLGSTPMTASAAMSYTDVTGQWEQPTASCKKGTPSSLAIWVGLGGYSLKSRELEQVGTSADCDQQGRPSYYIWYELVPAAPVTVKVEIAPGDTIVSVVKVTGSDVVVQVIDRTRGTRFTRHLPMSAPDLTSAEWVVEAPTQCDDVGVCNQLALPRFGSLAFTRTYATGNAAGGTITSPNWTQRALQLVPRSPRSTGGGYAATAGEAGAMPSGLLSDGTGFTVTWRPGPSVAGG